MNILDEIIKNKKKEIARQKEAISRQVLEKLISEQAIPSTSFKEALLNSSSGIIAEFKRKSPSKGWISEHAKVAEVIAGYERSGAAAISVLTDELFFGGSFEDFKIARTEAGIPLLRKDFIVDPYQIYQSKAIKADVILLIASALTIQETAEFAQLAHQLNLEVLLEIHREEELAHIGPNIDVVGINNRNLNTFETSVQQSFELGAKIPQEYVKISESGISDPETVNQLRNAGFNGFLMGENFMKTNDPGKALQQFNSYIR